MVMKPLINSDSDPGHLRGGPSHGHNTYYVKKSSQSEQWFLSYARRQTEETDRQTDRQTDIPKCITLALLSRSEGIDWHIGVKMWNNLEMFVKSTR